MQKMVIGFLSSLRLTVLLLALGIVLVFFGTLGQVSDGLYLAQERYFRSWFTTWYPVSLPWFHVPLPGGYLLGTLLVMNLCAAHFTRFKWSWKKSGIFLTHIGIMALLLGQLATDMLSVESQMRFEEGQTLWHSEDFHKNELVFVKDVPSTDRERVISIPESVLKELGEIQHPEFPFVLNVRSYHENADVSRFAPMIHTNREPIASAGMGARLVLDPLPATREMDRRNLPAVVFELKEVEGNEPSKTWLASALLRPDTIEAGGTTWRMELRPTRYHYPFELTLIKATHEKYLGTERPKNFQSRVRINNPQSGESRETDIYMNNPLRYAGLTFFQYQMGPVGENSTLQVVRNPSWLTPYVGCALVGVGLCVQFGIHLGGFLRKRFGSGKRSGLDDPPGSPPSNKKGQGRENSGSATRRAEAKQDPALAPATHNSKTL